jgi:hypothetical protein
LVIDYELFWRLDLNLGKSNHQWEILLVDHIIEARFFVLDSNLAHQAMLLDQHGQPWPSPRGREVFRDVNLVNLVVQKLLYLQIYFDWV